MNPVSVLLFPLSLALMPAGGPSGLPDAAPRQAQVPSAGYGQVAARPAASGATGPAPYAQVVLHAANAPEAWQMRIEQRMTIRITPRSAAPVPPNMFLAMPGDEGDPQFVERKIGKCLSASSIAGVTPNGGRNLLFYMRDRRVVTAELERTCRARDFYSGFLLSRSPDGKLCVDRDTLLSRSGMNCKLTRIRQLVEADH